MKAYISWADIHLCLNHSDSFFSLYGSQPPIYLSTYQPTHPPTLSVLWFERVASHCACTSDEPILTWLRHAVPRCAASQCHCFDEIFHRDIKTHLCLFKGGPRKTIEYSSSSRHRGMNDCLSVGRVQTQTPRLHMWRKFVERKTKSKEEVGGGWGWKCA